MDDLESQRRTLASLLLSDVHSIKDIDRAIDIWNAAQAPLIARWADMVEELHTAGNKDFAIFSVALRELLDIVQATEIRPDSSPVCLV